MLNVMSILSLLKFMEVGHSNTLLFVELAKGVFTVGSEALHGFSVEEAALRLVRLARETPFWPN